MDDYLSYESKRTESGVSAILFLFLSGRICLKNNSPSFLKLYYIFFFVWLTPDLIGQNHIVEYLKVPSKTNAKNIPITKQISLLLVKRLDLIVISIINASKKHGKKNECPKDCLE